MDVAAGVSDRKTELLELLSGTALQQASSPVSLRQFAIQAGVSEPTLRHHFHDRQGLVIAILRFVAQGASSFLARTASASDNYADAVQGYVDLAMEGFESDFYARAHAFALVESIHDPVVGQAYLTLIIEPSLAAIEARLQPSLDPDNADPDKVRTTAFFLYSPILMAILHQRLLRGDQVRPLDLPVFFQRLTALLTKGV